MRTHHGYAVNVKDYGPYVEPPEPLTEADAQEVYEQCQQGFWEDAELLAQEFAFERTFYTRRGRRQFFDGVYAEGRMGGWLVPHPQPETDDMSESELEAFERDFERFEAEVLALMEEWQRAYPPALKDAAADRRAEEEARHQAGPPAYVSMRESQQHNA